MTTKDKKIIEDSEREGIPIFVLTAKDECCIESINRYLSICTILGCDEEHLDGIYARIEEFEEWQNKNQNKVKLPD